MILGGGVKLELPVETLDDRAGGEEPRSRGVIKMHKAS